MEILTCILVFLFSFIVLFWSSNFILEILKKIAKFLSWKEFVVAFLTIAFATTIPNLIIDVISAINGVPQLALADVFGTNIVDLTLIVGLSALVSRAGLSLSSRTVQMSAFFTVGVAILPLLLIFDNNLSRGDGILLLSAFIFYLGWLFQKKERFEKIYDKINEPLSRLYFLKNLFLLVFSTIFLLLAGQGVVKSTVFLSKYFNLPLVFFGVLLVGFMNALPELTFTFQAARKSQDWFIAGNVMGSVIMTSTLCLGIVALIFPFEIPNLTTLAIARSFLLFVSLLFLIFIKTDKKITQTEGLCLLCIYVLFLLIEVSLKH